MTLFDNQQSSLSYNNTKKIIFILFTVAVDMDKQFTVAVDIDKQLLYVSF